LTPEELAFLEEHLSAAMKHLQVEEHRTRTLDYRRHVTREIEVLAGILHKLAAAPRACAPVGAGS
jgi:hypothetical protein